MLYELNASFYYYLRFFFILQYFNFFIFNFFSFIYYYTFYTITTYEKNIYFSRSNSFEIILKSFKDLSPDRKSILKCIKTNTL